LARPATHYLFVDGASLHGRLQNVADELFGGQTFEVDFQKLAENFTKVFYYDAIPLRDTDEPDDRYQARTQTYRDRHDRANRVDGIHVYEGDARKRRRRGYEQKKVDVMIAVDMMNHTFRRNMEKATLLTGDVDFKPLIDAVVRDGMYVTLWYPPGETGQELLDAADARSPLDLDSLTSLLTRESRAKFTIPVLQNRSSHRPDMAGRKLREYREGDRLFELWRSGEDYVLLSAILPGRNFSFIQGRSLKLFQPWVREHPEHSAAEALFLGAESDQAD
jgi:uncharacterized LabA/DUF88 family protein